MTIFSNTIGLQLTASSRRENGGAYGGDVFGGKWVVSRGDLSNYLFCVVVWSVLVLPQLELHEVVHCRLRSSPPRSSPGTTRRSRVVPGLARGGLELKLYEVATRDSTQVHQGQVQVQRGEAKLYLDLAAVDLS